MEFGERIKMLREMRGMTLEELGNAVGVGKSTVRKWEQGIIANMRRDKIAKVAKALDVSPGFLMGWEPLPYDLQFPPNISNAALIKKIGKLSLENRDMIERMVDALLVNQEKENS